jgi:hypothetical protein
MTKMMMMMRMMMILRWRRRRRIIIMMSMYIFVLNIGSDDTNIRLWKAQASKSIGIDAGDE